MSIPAPPSPSVIVTGASGFLGSALTARLRAAGRPVRGLSRKDGTLPGGYEDATAMARAFEGADAVFHLAARAHRGGDDPDFECNVRASRAVARAAREAGVPRVLLLSSIGVNGSVTRGKPFTETDEAAPLDAYARSKLRCEQELRAGLDGCGTRWVIVRPPLVYGPGAPGNFGRLVRAVQRGLVLPLGSVHNARTFLGLDNLLDLLVLCAEHPAAADELFVAGDAQDLSTPELVRCIADGLGRPARMIPFPPLLLQAAAALAGRRRLADSLCGSLQIDAAKARRLLGWIPRLAAPEGVRRAARAHRPS